MRRVVLVTGRTNPGALVGRGRRGAQFEIAARPSNEGGRGAGRDDRRGRSSGLRRDRRSGVYGGDRRRRRLFGAPPGTRRQGARVVADGRRRRVVAVDGRRRPVVRPPVTRGLSTRAGRRGARASGEAALRDRAALLDERRPLRGLLVGRISLRDELLGAAADEKSARLRRRGGARSGRRVAGVARGGRRLGHVPAGRTARAGRDLFCRVGSARDVERRDEPAFRVAAV
mmetsp:Transcript_24239/g.75729  ORF Transcript_24239/g.75729 Transcript_24239/m.75729 type:complete len:229 (+) Transcript_24239:772-1458(+)